MKIGHVHLKVRDLDRAEEFYRTLLGAKQTERLDHHYSFLSMGGAHHEVALQEIGPVAQNPTPDMIGLYHSAFEVNDTREFLSAIERMDELGVPCTLVDHGISWAAYTADPDGNGVEVYLDRRASIGGADAWKGTSRRLRKSEIVASQS